MIHTDGMKTVVLGMDPGPVKSGIAVVGDGAICYVTVLENDAAMDYVRRWAIHAPMCIESIQSYGQRVGQEVFDTCVMIGRFIEVSGDPSMVRLISRPKIKKHICGSASAKDADVREALIEIYGKSGCKSDPGPTYGIKRDGWAALSVATYAYDHLKELYAPR